MANRTFICVFDRRVTKASSSATCPACRRPMISMGRYWSAPRRDNDKAWARIEQGKIWWNRRRADKGSWYGGSVTHLSLPGKPGQYRYSVENSTYDSVSKYFLDELEKVR